VSQQCEEFTERLAFWFWCAGRPDPGRRSDAWSLEHAELRRRRMAEVPHWRAAGCERPGERLPGNEESVLCKERHRWLGPERSLLDVAGHKHRSPSEPQGSLSKLPYGN